LPEDFWLLPAGLHFLFCSRVAGQPVLAVAFHDLFFSAPTMFSPLPRVEVCQTCLIRQTFSFLQQPARTPVPFFRKKHPHPPQGPSELRLVVNLTPHRPNPSRSPFPNFISATACVVCIRPGPPHPFLFRITGPVPHGVGGWDLVSAFIALCFLFPLIIAGTLDLPFFSISSTFLPLQVFQGGPKLHAYFFGRSFFGASFPPPSPSAPLGLVFLFVLSLRH